MKKILTILMIAILILSYEKVRASEIATNSLLPSGVTYYEAFGTARPATLNQVVINSNYYVGFSQGSRLSINDNNNRVYFEISNVGNKSGFEYTYFNIYQKLGFAFDSQTAAYYTNNRPLIYLGNAPCEIYNFTSYQDNNSNAEYNYQQINVKCPTNTGGLTFIYDTNLSGYWIGDIRINRTIVYTKGDVNTNSIGQIIQNQTNEILNQNATYENNPEQLNGTTELNEYTQKEEQLFDNLDFDVNETSKISINPNASEFIWEIMEALRGINPAIVLLITSMLGIGIIKLVLNR